MDATRAEVERELKRVKDLLDMTKEEIEEQRDAIRQEITEDFQAVRVINGALLLRQGELEACMYFFAWRTLNDILKNTQPPAVGGGE